MPDSVSFFSRADKTSLGAPTARRISVYREAPNARARTICSDHRSLTASSATARASLTGAAAKVRLRHRLYAMGGFAVLIGVVAATIAGPIFGALVAPWILLAVTLTLLSGAVAFTTKALGAWLGAAGIGLAVLLLTTVGNAVSGATIGFDILPPWAQAISAILPPGAAFRAVNDFGYFNAATALSSLVVLAIWAVVGFALVLVRSSLSTKKANARAAATADGPTHPTMTRR